MESAIVTTKLRPPPERSGRAPRPRLDERIERGAEGRLTLLSAPAGYGKTTALASWARRTARAVAWLSLDPADNAPERFLRHLVAALQRRDETLRELGDFVGEDLEAALITVVNDVAANAEPLVLALDDYHVIAEERAHELVRFLLDHGPEQLRLVVSSRTDPPLGLPRRRVARELTEIRTEELRFTAAEAGAALQEQGLDLPESDVEELTLRTEGWPAGLHLAALSLRGRSDPHAFIGFFTGTDRFVLEYLTEEVLTRQGPDVQDFLLMTSVLDEFDAGLAGAVAGTAHATEMLRRIERDNLFLVTLDARGTRFRYHAFFQDLLAHRLESARPDLARELHLRAADALEARGETREALRHALVAGDEGRAARLAPAARGGRTGPPAKGAEAGTAARAPGAVEPAAVETGARDGAAADRARSPDEPLSEREIEVLRLIAAGLANKQIARRLGVSLNTVKTHARNAYAKLGVSSRTQAAARARQLGLA